jgi:hypothetical protein
MEMVQAGQENGPKLIPIHTCGKPLCQQLNKARVSSFTGSPKIERTCRIGVIWQTTSDQGWADPIIFQQEGKQGMMLRHKKD